VKISPAGLLRLSHTQGELAMARAAGKSGLVFEEIDQSLALLGRSGLEDIDRTALDIPGGWESVGRRGQRINTRSFWRCPFLSGQNLLVRPLVDLDTALGL